MRHGKHEYQLENMIQLNRDMIKQFEMLYLKQYNIDQDAIAPIAYEKWEAYFQFEQLEQWKALFTSDDIQEKSILIVGDYDVDGIMASKIALWICEQCGVEIVDVYIPNRFIDGYGLNKQIVQKAIDDEFDIILTVDNGVSAFEAIDYANEHGIDVLLTDHHHIKSSLPETKLILHPDKGTVNNGINICGAAVIFSLAYSLFKEESKHLVAYVMLATLADSMELHYLNRAFVKAGIDEIKSLDDPFIFQLIKQLEVDMNDAESLAWKLIPVLNAIGRMGDVNVFSEVLFWHSDDVEQAVNESIEINTLRKLETEKIVTDVIQTLNTDAIVCAKNEAWHQGVLGIAASRIVEMTQKPVILFSEKDGVNKGSGRSPEHFHLFDFLTLNSDNIHAFGGHAQACGLTLVDNQFDLLIQNIQKLEQVQPNPRSLDFDIHHLETKDFDILYAEMKKLAPFGNGMPAPIFHLSTSEHQVRLMGKNKEHVKLTLPNQMQLLFFNERDSWRITEQAQIHVVGSLSINRWQDSITYQSIVNDWWIDEIEFFYPNQVPITQNQHDEIVVIDHIPASNESFSTLKREIQAKGMCVLKWQDAQKEIMSVDDDVIRKVYKYFLQNKMVKIDQSLYMLMKRNGIEKNTLNFAIKVFLELEFAIIREGVLEIQTVTAKKQLSDSNIYQKMKFQYQFVEQVVYASHQKRKELFEHLEE